jgi:hypothetical protein
MTTADRLTILVAALINGNATLATVAQIEQKVETAKQLLAAIEKAAA